MSQPSTSMRCQRCALALCPCRFVVRFADGSGVCKKCAALPLQFEEAVELDEAARRQAAEQAEDGALVTGRSL